MQPGPDDQYSKELETEAQSLQLYIKELEGDLATATEYGLRLERERDALSSELRWANHRHSIQADALQQIAVVTAGAEAARIEGTTYHGRLIAIERIVRAAQVKAQGER